MVSETAQYLDDLFNSQSACILSGFIRVSKHYFSDRGSDRGTGVLTHNKVTLSKINHEHCKIFFSLDSI